MEGTALLGHIWYMLASRNRWYDRVALLPLLLLLVIGCYLLAVLEATVCRCAILLVIALLLIALL